MLADLWHNHDDFTVAVYLWCVGSLIALAWLLRFARAADRLAEQKALAALDTEAADWDEPSRAQVEWEQHIAQAVALSETPIQDALSAEQFKRDALAEIEQMTGGVA